MKSRPPVNCTIATALAMKGVSGRRLGAPEYADLSPVLKSVQETTGLVGVAAFVASADGLCAAGSAGTLWAASDSPAVSLWDSPWHAGSLTKSMTSSLAALLVADPSVPLSWDTTIGQLLPVEAGSTPYANVTLAQLLSHRGGFARWMPSESPTPDESFLELPLVEQRRIVMLYGLTTEPFVKPIQEGQYSNLGYMIAGGLLENVTGLAWEDLITDRLFDKLGMSSAYFTCPNSTKSPLGHSYNKLAGKLMPIPSTSWCDCMANTIACHCDLPPVVGPAGLVHMQLLDYVRYYQWHLAGHHGEDTSGLLSREEFQRLHSSMGTIQSGAGGELELEYGYGWVTMDHFWGGHVLVHDGSNGMWYANMVMSPTDNRVYFLATNSILNKTGEPPLGLNDILIHVLTSTYNDSACTPLDQLSMEPDVEVKEDCAEQIYGPLAENDTNDKDRSGALNKAITQVTGSLLVLLLLYMI